jgi:hypothetical protein
MLTAGQDLSNPFPISGTTETTFELFPHAVPVDSSASVYNPDSEWSVMHLLEPASAFQALLNRRYIN